MEDNLLPRVLAAEYSINRGYQQFRSEIVYLPHPLISLSFQRSDARFREIGKAERIKLYGRVRDRRLLLAKRANKFMSFL